MPIIIIFRMPHDSYKLFLKTGKAFPLPLFHRALHGAKIRKCNVLFERKITLLTNPSPVRLKGRAGLTTYEIDGDGAKIIVGKDMWHMVQNVPDVKKLDNTTFSVPFGDTHINISPARMTYFSPRAVLRIGMLLRDSEVAGTQPLL